MGIRLKLLGVGLGLAAAFWGWKERTLASKSGDDAVPLTCRALGESGPGENAHVRMSGFLLTSDFVCQTGKRDSAWTQVWVPAVPIDGEYARRAKEAYTQGGAKAVDELPSPKPVRVIVTSKAIASQAQLTALGDQEALDGLVVNSIESLDGEERALLEKTYGDVSAAQLLEVGRTRTNPWLAMLGLVGGSVFGLGVAATFFRRRPA